MPIEARRRILSFLEKLTPFSPVVRRLLSTISQDEDKVSLPAVGALVEQDTLIAGRVLGIANSAMYSRGHDICSVRQAVIRLGINRLRNLVLAISVNRIWGSTHMPDGFSMLRFNQHALATGIAADLFCERVAPHFVEHAFIAGLFHDIGQLILINMHPLQYATLLEGVHLEGTNLENCEQSLFGFTHSEASAEAIAYWHLPEEIQTAVRFHERPEGDETLAEDSSPRLSDLIHAADMYADAAGYSLIESQLPDDALQSALAPLGLEDESISPFFRNQLSILRSVA